MLRATHIVSGEVRVEYAVTLDGVLVTDLTPSYRLLRRRDGAVLAEGQLLPEAAPGLYAASASVTENPEDMRAWLTFSFMGLTVEEEAQVLVVAPSIEVAEILTELVSVDADVLQVDVQVPDETMMVDSIEGTPEIAGLDETIEVVSLTT